MLIDMFVSSMVMLVHFAPGIGSLVFLIGGIRSICVDSPIPAAWAVFLAAIIFNFPVVLRAFDIDESAFNAPVTAELVQAEGVSETKAKVESLHATRSLAIQNTAAPHQLVSSNSNLPHSVVVVAPTQTPRPNIVNLNSEISAN